MSSIDLPDQRGMWDRKHAADEHVEFRFGQTSLAEIFDQRVVPEARILEVGCGVGGDALYLADQGHAVVGTDFSEVVMAQNREHASHPNLSFVLHNTEDALPFRDEVFDGVFAYLSLHYFDDQTTQNIFQEIGKVIKRSGVFGFACKSIRDPGYGEGIEVEPNLFVSDKNHVRHFFSHEYIRELVSGLFEIEMVDEVVWENRANFIRCIATKS